jgi:hypothetical protein
MRIKNETGRKLLLRTASIILVLIILIILAYSQRTLNTGGVKVLTPTDMIQRPINENTVRTLTPFIIATQTNTLFPISNSMAIHITVVYWDQLGDIHTLLGNFSPAIGLTVRLRDASANNPNPVESSGVTNINGLALLQLVHPVIDEKGNTQEVNIQIDGYSEILTCRINAYYPGYFSKEIFLEGNKIRTYYPR